MIHYFYKNKHNDLNCSKELCFICFQLQNGNEQNSTKMNDIIKYHKNCECDAFIHVCCLDNWYYYHNECPICRITIEKTNFCIKSTFNLINHNNIHNNHFLKYVYYFFTILKIIIYFLLFIFIYGFYGTILYDYIK